jgi:AraC-like DNA-binding protein
MAESGAYGRRLGERLCSDTASALVSRTLRKSIIALTEIRCDDPEDAISDPIPSEDSFLVALQLRTFPRHEYWENGRQAPLSALVEGCTTLYDLKRRPTFRTNNPFHSLHFYLPRATLDAVADDADAPRIGELRYAPGQGVDDPMLRALGALLRPALERPEQANRIFVDHIMAAVGAHVAATYGEMKAALHPARGGLAPWQARRAREIIEANLDGEISLTQLAAACGVSVSHFSRAFRRTMGLSPHRWLLRRRVDVAKTLLCRMQTPLSDVALACGFADQSHFTRVFTNLVGISPGAWRRLHDDRG